MNVPMSRRRFLAASSVGLGLTALGAVPAAPSQAVAAMPKAAKTTLGIDGKRALFLINEKPTFLLGISYYGGLGASEAFLEKDFADILRYGFNWIRVWVTWAAFENDVSAFDADGRPREPFLSRLKALCERCDAAGMILDATFSRGNRAMTLLATHAAHMAAARTLAEALKPYRNVYFDLGNERNLKDRRLVTIQELAELRAAVKQVDPDRLMTASHAGGEMTADDVREYVATAGVDFLSPHRPRSAKSPQETADKTREFLRAAEASGRRIPVHYQEPFRRHFSPKWEPTAADFLADLKGAIAGGAAGWCFHNGGNYKDKEGRPRRSFDMRPEEGRLFDQLEPLEKTVAESVAALVAAQPGKA